MSTGWIVDLQRESYSLRSLADWFEIFLGVIMELKWDTCGMSRIVLWNWAWLKQARDKKEDLLGQQVPFPGTVITAETDTLMNIQQLLQFIDSSLSIVLCYHHQKEDIKTIMEGTNVDFKLIRDPMYKYSKKAEEKFFQNACMAYFFIQFSQSLEGKSSIQNKLSRTAKAEN